MTGRVPSAPRACDLGAAPRQSHVTRRGCLATGSYDESIRVIDPRRPRAPVARLAAGGGVWRLKWHPGRWEGVQKAGAGRGEKRCAGRALGGGGGGAWAGLSAGERGRRKGGGRGRLLEGRRWTVSRLNGLATPALHCRWLGHSSCILPLAWPLQLGHSSLAIPALHCLSLAIPAWPLQLGHSSFTLPLAYGDRREGVGEEAEGRGGPGVCRA